MAFFRVGMIALVFLPAGSARSETNPQRGPVETFVIDHVELPTPD